MILGRRTYEWVMKQVPVFSNADKETYVITRTPKASEGNTVFYAESLKDLVTTLNSRPGKNIFIDGGAEVVTLFLKDKLIDEMVISIIPVLLGDGVRLFKDGRPEHQTKLISTEHFDSGLVQLKYELG